jgi:phosphoserine phosphatase
MPAADPTTHPVASPTSATPAPDPLPSWRDGTAKRSLVAFVEGATLEGSSTFVPAADRIAVFDNDGTLWCEQPVPVQAFFALDRVKALAPEHPEWRTREPFASLLAGRIEAALAGGEEALLEVVMATHAGMTTTEFAGIVEEWIASAKHPKTGRRYIELVYRPMLEVLAYLRARGFRTYIVSGGGIEFMRPWAERVYGVPPEQVIGSSIRTKFERRDGRPALVRLPELFFNNDKSDKVVAINHHIGRRPVAAFGNSVGDQHMVEYTLAGAGSRFGLLVLHDDATREFAYGPALGMRRPPLGAFTQELLDQAQAEGWTVASMKNDWAQVFPHEPSSVTAINILLEPDAAMTARGEADNASLRKVFPNGFALDATHRPHLTLLQRFVRTADLDRVCAAAAKVLAGADLLALRLEAVKYYYIPGGPIGLAGIVVKTPPGLADVQRALIEAVAPYTAASGFPEAFHAMPGDAPVDAQTIAYVAGFVPNSSGENFKLHLTTGIGPRDHLDKLLAAPFEPFTFSPAGAAVYQLGHYGTARKKLHDFALQR